MKVETLSIKRYKTHKWLDMHTQSIVYGIDIVVMGKSYHVMEGKEPLIFENKMDAIKHVKKLNKELKDERSVATEAK